MSFDYPTSQEQNPLFQHRIAGCGKKGSQIAGEIFK